MQYLRKIVKQTKPRALEHWKRNLSWRRVGIEGCQMAKRTVETINRVASSPRLENMARFLEERILRLQLTKEMKLVKALRKSREKYRKVIENIRDIIYTATPDGTLSYVSPQVFTILGYQPDELIGRKPIEIVHPEDVKHVLRDYRRTIETGEEFPTVFRFIAKDGTPIYVEEFGKAIKKGDRVVQVTGVIRDITERVEMEEERRKHELCMQVLRKLGEIAHDGKNILFAITAGARAGMLMAKGTDFYEVFQDIYWSTELLTEMLDNLLDISKTIKISVEPLPIKKSINKGVKAFLPALNNRNITMEDSVSNEMQPVCHDTLAIQRMIMNLLLNSVDAMPFGGKIKITAREERLKEALPARFNRIILPGRYHCIEVSDTGSGMPTAEIEKMFEFYQSTKKGRGVGIGLAYVKKVVEAHDGFIRVKTNQGGGDSGTTFAVYLPVK